MLNQLIEIENNAILNIVSAQPSVADDLTDLCRNAHMSVINGLIKTYIKFHTDSYNDIFCSYFEQPELITDINLNICAAQIPALCEQLHILFLNSAFNISRGHIVRRKSKQNLIDIGAVYTREDISYDIVSSTLGSINAELSCAKILDFACGTGRFYDAVIKYMADNKMDLSKTIRNIYAIDIDPAAINITRLKALHHIGIISEENCKIVKNNIILRNALVKSTLFADFDNALQPYDLDGLVHQGFDAIVSNPPYLVLKPSKKKFGSDTYERTKRLAAYFRSSGIYRYSVEGMLNYYQISIEAMLQMLKYGGELGIICPSTLFADVSATQLRRHLLLENRVRHIRYFGEKEPLFVNVTQATNIFHLTKGGRTDIIEVCIGGAKFQIDIDSIQKLFNSNLEVPGISGTGWSILNKMSKFPKLKEYKNIRNKRGELDLTLCKEYVTTTPTKYRLVRGNMISTNGIRDINNEYVDERFLLSKSSDYMSFDFGRKRLVCQQISNMTCKKRLRFVYCDGNDILGNSCNYISSNETTLAKLHILLNSSLLNWRFKITSSNNHINNYELAELPVVDLSKIDAGFQYKTIHELDRYVGELYALTEDEINYLADDAKTI